ncbi:MAG TPA: hypothetical protein VLA33_00270 [Gemmatimonadota bacterium]|nr:hypothetical protein [Gemmatimonadota bacterium]
MQPVLLPVGALALRLAAGVAALWFGLVGAVEPPVPSPCGDPFGGLRPADVTYVLATARADTVPDPAADRTSSFGQLADVVRVAGAGAGPVTAATGDDRSIVLVPWGFDEGCRPIGWTGSWSWATPDVEGFYRGRLRTPDDWVGGRPTFDVHAAVWEGFPDSPWRHPTSNGREFLTAPELFDLYDRLPTAEAISIRPYGAVSDLVTWRREAGDLAERYPARTLLAEAFDIAELARLRTTMLPFAGTYRVQVQRDGETLATFLLRTGSVGSEPLTLDEETAASASVPAAPRPAAAVAAAAGLALDEEALEDLPAACSNQRGLRAATDEADDGAAAGALRAWSAELLPHFVAFCFYDSPVLAGLQARESAADAGPFGGAFRHEMDGRFSFRQAARLQDGTSVVLVGDRIDVTALPGPPPVPTG